MFTTAATFFKSFIPGFCIVKNRGANCRNKVSTNIVRLVLLSQLSMVATEAEVGEHFVLFGLKKLWCRFVGEKEPENWYKTS